MFCFYTDLIVSLSVRRMYIAYNYYITTQYEDNALGRRHGASMSLNITINFCRFRVYDF